LIYLGYLAKHQGPLTPGISGASEAGVRLHALVMKRVHLSNSGFLVGEEIDAAMVRLGQTDVACFPFMPSPVFLKLSAQRV